jgi:hypothetical protein
MSSGWVLSSRDINFSPDRWLAFRDQIELLANKEVDIPERDEALPSDGPEKEGGVWTRVCRLEDEASILRERLRLSEADLRRIRRSLAYLLGQAIATNLKHPLRWPMIPIALIRAVVRYRNAGAAKSGTPLPLDNLVTAFDLIERGEREKGLAFAEERCGPGEAAAINLLRANADIDDEALWVGHVNAYLAAFGMDPVALSEGSEERFLRIRAQAAVPIAEGPLVSVIMPAYNAATTLEHAAGSILAQSWQNLELIIVDDASDDETYQVADSLARVDDRVTLFRNAQNVGPYVSRNVALLRASGDYVTCHDADDWAHPNRIAKDVGAILASNGLVKATISKLVRMEAEGRFGHFSKINRYTEDGATRTAFVSCLVEKSVLQDRVGFWDSVRFGADGEFIGRLTRVLGDRLAWLNHVGMICLDTPTSLTNDPQHGVSTRKGLSASRRAYRDAFEQWHERLTAESVYLGFPLVERPFAAPPASEVDLETVREVVRRHAASRSSG